MKKLTVFLSVMVFFLAFAGMSQAGVVYFEKFDDSSGFTTGGGGAAYWGVAPLSGTASIPSNFVQGDSQDGNIFFGSFAKSYSGSPAATMTIVLPDLSGYANTNLDLIVALASPVSIYETSHRDSFYIIGGTTTSPPLVDCTNAGCLPVTGAIDSFLPYYYGSSFRSQVYSTDLTLVFQDFRYSIDSNLKSITFAYASTDYPEVIGIDSVRIIAAPVPEPSTMLLLGSGLLGLVGYGRRRYKK